MADSDEVVSFDVAAARAGVEAALEDGALHVVAPFTPDEYEVVHCDELTRSFYADDAEMTDHFDTIHRYAGIDFSEIGLFVDDLFPVGGGVEYIATGMEHLTVVRLYVDREGLLLTLDADADVTAAVEAVRDAIDSDLGATGGGLSASES